MRTIKKIIRKLSTPSVQYYPLIEVRIFKDALLHNLHEYQKLYPKVQFAPVIKSNGYGHGMVQVAKILDNEDIAFFMVDSFFEALVLRREGVKSKILILGFATEEQIYKTGLKNCSWGIISLETLKHLSKNLKTKKAFHLKIDTGMHRQGILVDEIDEATALIKHNSNIILEGLCSHFADAEDEYSAFTNSQIAVWNKVVETFKQQFLSLQYFHVSNTAGTHYLNQATANVGRIGIGLYGMNPSPLMQINLQPALELKSIISSIKNIPAGAKVGYDVTYESKQPMCIATVPVGYNEGVDRRLSNIGCFKVRGVFCPIIGRVSMNMCTIDVSSVPEVKLEDEVIVFSGNKQDKNSIDNAAKISGCLQREILVHIPQYLKRAVV